MPRPTEYEADDDGIEMDGIPSHPGPGSHPERSSDRRGGGWRGRGGGGGGEFILVLTSYIY